MMVRRIGAWFDVRFGTNAAIRYFAEKIFPDHWSFFLGEFALYCFVALVGTGIWLTFAVHLADPDQVYASVLLLTDRAHPIGYLIRQVHHWAAVTFVASILVHMGRIFFTAAFRRPRELNWCIGLTLLVLASLTGFTGYSIPADELSGTGVRIADAVALSVPFIGRWASDVITGGGYPGTLLETHLYTIHVYYLPVAIGALLAIHLGLVVYQKHTQFVPDPAHVVGRRMWPDYALRALWAFALSIGVLVAIASVLEINPIEDYPPYRDWLVPNPATPDWYAAFLDGALRLGPHQELRIFGHPIAPVFWPGVVLPVVTFTILGLWPWIDAWLTGDRAHHDVLQLPTQAAWRVGFGAALITDGIVLTLAASDDQQALTWNIDLEALVWAYRILLVVGPFVVGWVAAWIAGDLRRRRHGNGVEQVVTLQRSRSGGYEERPA